MKYKILAVDDEKLILKGIKFSLEQDGMDVDVAYDGEEACNLADENKYDLIVLDIMLPFKNGFEVCQHIRAKSNTPIIMLTAKNDDMDKILGLEFGADDYLTKPFNILELKARVKAILRRSTMIHNEEKAVTDEIVVKDIRLNLKSNRVYLKNIEIKLTIIEYNILKLFLTNKEKIFTRNDVYESIWKHSERKCDTRTIDVHIRRLREKIEESPSLPKYIKTKWGVGYYLG